MNEIQQSPRSVWESHARDGKFAYQWSPDAERAVWHPRVCCPFGGRTPLEWRVSAGQGVIHSITLTHPVKGEPYAVALVDLDEGFRVMSCVEGASGVPNEIGRRVRLRFVDWEGEAVPVPVFDLEPG